MDGTKTHQAKLEHLLQRKTKGENKVKRSKAHRHRRTPPSQTLTDRLISFRLRLPDHTPTGHTRAHSEPGEGAERFGEGGRGMSVHGGRLYIRSVSLGEVTKQCERLCTNENLRLVLFSFSLQTPRHYNKTTVELLVRK